MDINDQAEVEVPILYGRKASTRGETFTMVFSPSQGAGGSAKAVGCKSDVNTSDDLIAEATELWTAETKGINQQNRVSSQWGCVALLVKDTHTFPNQILTGWHQRVANEQTHYNGFNDYNQQPIVTPTGHLNITWPNAAAKFDLLLATANRLKPKARPTSMQIAEAWWTNDLKNVEYFIMNRKSGIRTADDANILTTLSDRLQNL